MHQLEGHSPVTRSGSDTPIDRNIEVPTGLTPGTTVLIASTASPNQNAIDFRILCEQGTSADTAVVVSTTQSADETITAYDQSCPESERPNLGIVDTVSKQQSVTALYGDTPVVFTPAPSDLEQLVVALSDVASDHRPANGTRHFLIRSLSPILETTSVTKVGRILERITGLRTGDGVCLLGLEYTAHDDTTVESLSNHADGILWVERSSTDDLEVEYQPITHRYTRQ